MSKIFVIADLHLYHKNILKYSPSRIEAILEDFPQYKREDLIDNNELSLWLMEKMLIKRWNEVVPKDGHVYILGDLTLSKNKEMISDFLKKLNGYKHLVRGNHDILPGTSYIECGFSTVSNHPIFWNGILLSHQPIAQEYIASSMFNYFGHVHEHSEWNWSRGQCISCEQTDFKPYEITKQLSKGINI